jgi:iron-sulfur cluster assembly 1
MQPHHKSQLDHLLFQRSRNLDPRFDLPKLHCQSYVFAFKFSSLPLHDAYQTPKAVLRLRALLNGPIPQLIRIGVRNKGCAGLSYNLEYVEKPGKFDEVVKQDGIRVVIDSKALFSIIGSEMDWTEDALRHVLSLVSRGFLLHLSPSTALDSPSRTQT